MERTTTYRLMWCCTRKEALKCRARVVTFGSILFIKYMDHNHAPMLKKGRKYMRLKMILGESSERKHPRRTKIKEEIEKKIMVTQPEKTVTKTQGLKLFYSKRDEHCGGTSLIVFLDKYLMSFYVLLLLQLQKNYNETE
nr:unnamed protein product [Callosobruchus analis]